MVVRSTNLGEWTGLSEELALKIRQLLDGSTDDVSRAAPP
jgi:hypothetical protein